MGGGKKNKSFTRGHEIPKNSASKRGHEEDKKNLTTTERRRGPHWAFKEEMKKKKRKWEHKQSQSSRK